ncbi:hypothetical protein RHS01_08123 [Rhizoctonia solani]|uniref:Uncharacterized protein n=1 Tax=Rhizoctonia solani TaxID=456999 RepID=A0A8H7I8C0_9AGAM|nr:hypothetical protein RHS01_08123 [Rhizoctonia solani]
MEPEPSIGALLKAIQALNSKIGSLQDQVKSQGEQITQLTAICRETNDLIGDKDQGKAQAKPGPLTGPVTLPLTWETKPTLQARLGLDLRPRSALQEERDLTQKMRNQGPPKKSLQERLEGTWDPSLPSTQGPAGRKATQWLDQMMLWVALHCDQFDKEEQMVVWILYHMTDKAADWALPIIGAIIKGEGNPPTTIQALTSKFKEAFADPNAKRAAARKIAALSQATTTAEYVMEFRNLMAELDWNEEAYIAQFTQGLHWKVKELLSTKDSVPNELKAIFAASIKIDNIRRKNEENRPKKAPAKSPATVATTSTTTTQRVCLSEDPNYVTPEERDRRARLAYVSNAAKRGMASNNALTDGRPQSKRWPREYNIAIDLVPEAKLTPGPIYGMTNAESKALKQHIDEELATGKIRPSTSSAGPLKLNDVTHKNVYPLPRQDDLMAKLRNAKIFTKLDLQWGYNNVRIKEGDEWKTAFRTKYGLFEYLVMPFGLTNAPAAFQHFMNDLFRDLINVTVVIYLDDILIFSEKEEEHLLHETPWSWGNLEEVAFQKLKSLVTKSPVLIHSNPDLPYYLETDALGVAMGAILSQQGEDNQLHPIAYMSKSFLGAEANYDTHDKELLAIIKALEEWRIFLEATDRPIQVFTDHRNLEYWMQAQTFNRRHARWRTFLSDFHFEIHYRPGKQSGKPDALSRRSNYVDTPAEPEVMLPAEVFANTSEEELDIITEIRTRLRDDPSLEPIITFLTEDADNAPPSIQKAYQDYNWEEISYANRRTHAPVISLKPLEVPPYPFHTISYDFITGLPKSQGHDAILVVIDSFSKFGHFIPTSKKVTSKGLTDLFITHVWKLHGLPIRTILDRRTMFTSKFLRALYQRLGVKPSFSSTYHPESDGQTERVNQFIEFYLRSYIAANHSDWTTWLPLAEYAYNNAKHASTGKTPFELVFGRNPVMNPSNVPANVPEADEVADTLAREWKEAKAALRLSKERMTRKQGTVPETKSNKLDPNVLGPSKSLRKSPATPTPRTPGNSKIHDVFYVGLLSKSHESPNQPFPEQPPPETIEGEEEYEVEQIIDSKRQKGKWFYLIKWKGYGPEDNSWEPEELLEHSQEEIKRFNQARLRKACDAAKSL